LNFEYIYIYIYKKVKGENKNQVLDYLDCIIKLFTEMFCRA
jgi:hypothetical protein